MIHAFGGMRPRPVDYVLLDRFVFALLLRCEIAIGLAFIDELSCRHPMLFGIVRLKNNLFVVIKSQPFEAFNDRARRFISRALQIGIFDAQQKLTAQLAREQPIEKRRARCANVQITGW